MSKRTKIACPIDVISTAKILEASLRFPPDKTIGRTNLEDHAIVAFSPLGAPKHVPGTPGMFQCSEHSAAFAESSRTVISFWSTCFSECLREADSEEVADVPSVDCFWTEFSTSKNNMDSFKMFQRCYLMSISDPSVCRTSLAGHLRAPDPPATWHFASVGVRVAAVSGRRYWVDGGVCPVKGLQAGSPRSCVCVYGFDLTL